MKFAEKKCLYESIRNKQFVGIGKFRLSMIYLLSLDIEAHPVSYYLKKVLSIIFGRYYEVKYNNCGTESKIAFLYSSSYPRRVDYMNNFNNICGLVGENEKVVIRSKPRLNINVHSITTLFYFVPWSIQLSKYKINAITKIFILSELCEAYVSFYILKSIINTVKIKAITVFCDTHLVDSLIVDYCKKVGIKTVTLQHGHMSEYLEKAEAFNSSFHFAFSDSDYFLTFGEYSKNLAVKSGINENKLISLGMMNHALVKKPSSIDLNSKGVFGILFNWELEKLGNVMMIQIANDIAVKMNMKYRIKYHPSNNIDEYSKYINHSVYITEPDVDISVINFGKEMDFTIIGKSTVFLDMVYLLCPVFRYVYDGNDAFPEFTWCKFTNFSTFYQLYEKYYLNKSILESKLIECRKLLSSEGDVGENYKSFYKKLTYEVLKEDICL